MPPPDHNYRGFADETDAARADLTVDPAADGLSASDFDDLLKLSHCRNWTLTRFVVRGGTQHENAIDLNRDCSNVLLEDGVIEAGAQNAITIKGGATNTTLRRIEIARAGGHCDIELGNWSDQSRERTTGTHLERVWRTDGQPLRIRCGNADWPTVTDCKVKRMYLQSFALKLYLFFKAHFAS